MQKLVVFVIVALASASARPGGPAPKPEDRNRETKIFLEDPGVLNLQHRQKLYQDAKHRLDGTALLNKDLLEKRNPTIVGGRLDYNYNQKTNVGLEALNAGRFGTKVGVEATRNIFKDRNSAWDVGASYGQHFGGPGGRSEPVFGGFLRAHF